VVKQGVSMMTLIGFIAFFIVGYGVGMMVENEHHKQKQIKWAKKRHPVGSSIEAQMARDGWKI
jgi:hypothetical protein